MVGVIDHCCQLCDHALSAILDYCLHVLIPSHLYNHPPPTNLFNLFAVSSLFLMTHFSPAFTNNVWYAYLVQDFTEVAEL